MMVRARAFACGILIASLNAAHASATEPCRNADEFSSLKDRKFSVRTVRVHFSEGRAATVDELKGREFSPELLDQAGKGIEAYLREARLVRMRAWSMLSLLYSSSCVRVVDEAARSIDIDFYPLVVTVGRSNTLAGFQSQPSMHRPKDPEVEGRLDHALASRFHPSTDFEYDPATTTSLSGGIAVAVPTPGTGAGAPTGALFGGFRKSLTDPFYDGRMDLRFRGSMFGKLDAFGVATGVQIHDTPYFTDRVREIAARLGVSAEASPGGGPFHWLSFGTHVQYSLIRDQGPTAVLRRKEVSATVRTVADGFWKGGFFRVVAWLDGAGSRKSDAYYRFAGAGYFSRLLTITPRRCKASEVRGCQKIDLDITAGAGQVALNAPVFRRFYGGNQPSYPLYGDRDGLSLAGAPDGPLIHSYGERRLGPADAYWHANGVIGVPYLGVGTSLFDSTFTASRPQLDPPHRREAMASTQALLMATYIGSGMDDTKASKLVRSQLREMSKEVNFLTERACYFCVRVVGMFDVAQTTSGDTRFLALAAGGGLRFALPYGLAKGEVGYLYNLRRFPTLPAPGAFVLRIHAGKAF